MATQLNGPAVLLPAALIGAVLIAWKLGAGPVLCFWLAYILTRPLGANLGDFLGSSPDDGGLGLGPPERRLEGHRGPPLSGSS